MPVLRISVNDTRARLHGSSAPLLPTLRQALTRDPGPITLMVHGYKYTPGHPQHCPHGTLFSPRQDASGPRVISWPRHLGLRGQPGEGLGLSFGWSARCSIWEAHRRAEDAGRALAGLLGDLHRLAPRRPVHVVAHSLGARVALAALHDAPVGSVQRMILLAAAEYAETARAALATPAGRDADVLNVTSRENDLFDFLLERLVAPPAPGDRMLGHGSPGIRNMVTLQLDDPDSLSALQQAGFPIAPPQRRICHWSPYLRPGVFPLYRAFLGGDMPLPLLRACLPNALAPRWSRLMPRRQGRTPLALPAE